MAQFKQVTKLTRLISKLSQKIFTHEKHDENFTVYITSLVRNKPFPYIISEPENNDRVRGAGYLKIEGKQLRIKFNVKLLATGKS